MREVKDIININYKLKNLPENYIKIFNKVFSLCNKYNRKVYLIGGMVRNIILNKDCRDFDFVVSPSSDNLNLEKILSILAGELNGKYKYIQRFKTGNIKLNSGLNLDFATARKEYYQFPGSLPEISTSNLKDDLKRRDFTINTLLMEINPEKRGIVYDYFGGLKDLDNKIIRVLYSLSFIDDPTRIIRGIRQAVELDFDIEEKTQYLMKDALKSEVFTALSKDRVFKELKIFFKNEINNKSIYLLRKISVFNLLNLNINLTKNRVDLLSNLEGILAYFKKKNYNVKDWLLRLAVILGDISPDKLSDLNLAKKEESILTFFISERNKYVKLISNCNDPSLLAELLNNLSIEKNILLMLSDKQVSEKIIYFYEKLINIDLTIDGNDLINLGLGEGPDIEYVLKKVFKAKVKGLLKNYQEELEYSKILIEDIERGKN